MTNLIKALFMNTAEIRAAAWDFYAMGNEIAACLCIMELKRRDPKGTAVWIDEMINDKPAINMQNLNTVDGITTPW